MKHTTIARSARRGLLGAAAALALALAPAPALALGVAPSSAQELPASIDASVPDDATLISSEYALLSSGEVVRVSDGSAVEGDASVLGTEDAPPDPLAVSGGERFERVSVAEAREAIAGAEGSAELLSLDGAYGAYWGTYQDAPAFFMADGRMFACQAKGVVDVSEHNGTIDWEAAKADGVEGAIIRIGFGYDRVDYTARRNISECKRLGIPFGIYLYSYAETPQDGRDEGRNLVQWLRELDVQPSDLGYPVFYDLEQWVWTGHQPPTDPAVYEQIVRSWLEEVLGGGYSSAGVYSYRSYLYGPLNSSYIHDWTLWAAEYGPSLGFDDFGSVARGWQYTSDGQVAGFSGRVDLNAFGNATWVQQGGGSVMVPSQPEEGCPSAGFTDIAYDEWYHEGVDWVVSAGLMSGYGNDPTKFGPADSLSRAQLAQIIWNRAGKPQADLTVLSAFSDCPRDEFFSQAVAWCVQRGYMTGYENGTFGPADNMTREQLATTLWRMSGYPASGADLSGYPDAAGVSQFAQTAMRWAVSEGAITGQGSTGRLDPQGKLERGQAATILMRLYA